MQNGNWMLAEELELMRRGEIHRELAHERFLASHGLDLWSVLRRAVTDRIRPGRRMLITRAIPLRPVGRSPSAAVPRARARVP